MNEERREEVRAAGTFSPEAEEQLIRMMTRIMEKFSAAAPRLALTKAMCHPIPSVCERSKPELKCIKCGREMNYLKSKTSESWFCWYCNHGIIKPRLWIGRLWNILYGLKTFFMDFRTIMRNAKENLRRGM